MKRRRWKILFLSLMGWGFFFANPVVAWGQDFSTKFSLDWYNYADGKDLNPRQVDPTNQILDLPYLTLDSDIRPDIKISLGDFDLRVQPRWQITQAWINYNNPAFSTNPSSVSETYGYFNFSQAYLNWTASDVFIFSFGLQNFQWGPAEIISPSNGFIHFNQGQRSLLWVEPGHWLARVNISPTKNWSLVGLAELSDNQQAPWIAGTGFTPRAMAKLEYRTDDGTNYFGVTAGSSLSALTGSNGTNSNINTANPNGITNTQPWVGEYGTYTPLDGLSLYVDSRQVQGSYAYYPEQVSGNFIQMQQSLYGSSQFFALTAAGIRYETRVDMRLEFIQNTLGYSQEDFLTAVEGASLPGPFIAANIADFNYPGLELYGQYYVYGSIRIPDLGKDKLYTIMARYLYSITDESSTVLASFQRSWGDHANLFLELSYMTGESNTELNFLTTAEVDGGLRLSF